MSAPQSVLERKKEFMKDYVSLLRSYRDKNLELRDDFAAEKTYKFSNLIITLSVGVVGAMSFLISGYTQLNTFSKLLVWVLVLPILSVILELIYKSKVLETNRKVCDDRIRFIDKFRIEEVLPRFVKEHQNDTELLKTIKEVDKIAFDGFQKISQSLLEEEKKWNPLRWLSFGLLIVTLIGLVLIILIESGTLTLLITLLQKEQSNSLSIPT